MGDRPATGDGDHGPRGHGPGTGSTRGRFTVRRLGSVDSTNTWLLDAARAGAPEGLVVVAEHQAAGRGRRGRTWEAPAGSSLLVSVLLRPAGWRPALAAERIHVLTMATGLALAEAVGDVAGIGAALKWPNDLVVGDRKLAGLLAEAEVSAGGEVDAVVLGAGCNVSQRAFPNELAATATSCAIEAGSEVDREAVLAAFLDRLDRHLGALAAVPAAYRDRLATLGRIVRVDLGTETVQGRAVGVDDVGRLQVERADGSRLAVAVGDVVHLRPT